MSGRSFVRSDMLSCLSFGDVQFGYKALRQLEHCGFFRLQDVFSHHHGFNVQEFLMQSRNILRCDEFSHLSQTHMGTPRGLYAFHQGNNQSARAFAMGSVKGIECKQEYLKLSGLDSLLDVSTRSHLAQYFSNSFPENQEKFQKNCEKLFSICQLVCEWILLRVLQGCKHPDPSKILELHNKNDHVLEVKLYPIADSGQVENRFVPHKDLSTLTLLLEDSPGLQVLLNESDWISAEQNTFDPCSMLVNAGDFLETIIGVKSAVHKVECAQERLSVAFFYTPNWDAEIEPGSLAGDRMPYLLP